MIGSKTFEELVTRSGLSPMFATHVMARAIMRAHAFPDQLRPQDLVALTPALEHAIRPFLRPDEAERVITSLVAWIAAAR